MAKQYYSTTSVSGKVQAVHGHLTQWWCYVSDADYRITLTQEQHADLSGAVGTDRLFTFYVRQTRHVDSHVTFIAELLSYREKRGRLLSNLAAIKDDLARLDFNSFHRD